MVRPKAKKPPTNFEVRVHINQRYGRMLTLESYGLKWSGACWRGDYDRELMHGIMDAVENHIKKGEIKSNRPIVVLVLKD